MYCIKCGAKLADSEIRCPLCATVVYHPELEVPQGETLYPQYRYPAPEVSSRAALIVVSTLMTIALLITLVIDLQINGEVTWSGFVAGGIGVAYIGLVMPFWFKRVNPVLYVPSVFVSVAVYLLYISCTTEGRWYFSFALPVTIYLGILITVQAWLLKRWRSRALPILGGGLIAVGVLMPLMEYLIYLTFSGITLVGWSLYPLISLVLLGAMLIFLAVNRRAREKMEEKFFI